MKGIVFSILGVIGGIAALIQLHKWGLFEKTKHIYYLNRWAFGKENEDIRKVYSKKYLYIEKLGRIHKKIRKEYIGLSLRKMSLFYQNIHPSKIENLEKGSYEISNESIEKFKSFFSIEPDYIETGEGYVFKHYYGYKKLIEYIKNGYYPFIFCPPRKYKGEEDIKGCPSSYSYIYLIKEENGLEKSFKYGDPLNFYPENESGKHSVKQLICALLINNKEADIGVSIIAVNNKTWYKILDNSFYLKHEKISTFSVHLEHQDRYLELVDKVTNKYEAEGRC